jgi:hypothetical protein
MSRQCFQWFQLQLLLTLKLSLQLQKLVSVNIGSKCILLKPTCRFSKRSLEVEKINTLKWRKLLKMLQVRNTQWSTLMTVSSWWEPSEEWREPKKRSKRMKSALMIYLKLIIIPCQFKTSLILSSLHALSTIILFLFNCATAQLKLIITSFGTSRSMLSEESHILNLCKEAQ